MWKDLVYVNPPSTTCVLLLLLFHSFLVSCLSIHWVKSALGQSLTHSLSQSSSSSLVANVGHEPFSQFILSHWHTVDCVSIPGNSRTPSFWYLMAWRPQGPVHNHHESFVNRIFYDCCFCFFSIESYALDCLHDSSSSSSSSSSSFIPLYYCPLLLLGHHHHHHLSYSVVRGHPPYGTRFRSINEHGWQSFSCSFSLKFCLLPISSPRLRCWLHYISGRFWSRQWNLLLLFLVSWRNHSTNLPITLSQYNILWTRRKRRQSDYGSLYICFKSVFGKLWIIYM